MASYTVQPGDTLSAIATANGITLAEVIRLNPQIANPDLIHPGDEVVVSEDVVTAAIEEASAGAAAEPVAAAEAVAEGGAEATTEEAPAIPEALTPAVDAAATPAEAPAPVVEGRFAE